MRASPRLVVLLSAPVLAAGALTAPAGLQALASSPTPSAFEFAGSGWGHGVGMSQYGALGMAREGHNAREIIKHYFTGAKAGPRKDKRNIRVNLRRGATNVRMRTEAIEAGGGRIRVKHGSKVVTAGPGENLRFRAAGPGRIEVLKGSTVMATSNKWHIRWSGTRYPGGQGRKASLVNLVDPGQSWTSAGHRYRYGKMRVLSSADGSASFDVVNVVRLHDEYLYGIAEMPSSWPQAALRAQVIAARSYALVKRKQGLRKSCHCDVDHGVTDQVFAGYVKETDTAGAAWRRAVDATHKNRKDGTLRGLVVIHGGKPVQAFYSSSTGGRTQNSEDVWSAALPYLRSVDDRWSLDDDVNPYASWGPVRRTQRQVAEAFGVGDVASLDLSSRYASGALRTVVATTSGGKKVSLAGSTFVSRLGLTSRWVKDVTPVR